MSSNAGGDGSKVPDTNSKYDFIKKFPHIRVSNQKIENKYKHILQLMFNDLREKKSLKNPKFYQVLDQECMGVEY